jgi:hypothetical protein
MKRLGLMMLAGLAACGTPQEQCVGRETRDLRQVDRLIAEVQGNLDRGYAIEEVVVYKDRWVQCPAPVVPPVEGEPPPPAAGPQLCLDEVRSTEKQAKAINLKAEAETLASLKVKRRQLARDAQAGIDACKATYPE